MNVIFADYTAEAACNPARVLETAAGTGIVTRRLRDVLPVSVRLTATDLNPPMLEIARTKFRAGEQVDFQPADATELAATADRDWLSGLLSRGFEDQVRDFVGMGDQGEMARLHLDGLGAHAFGHEALEVRIDRAVLGRNGVIARL
jgi:hypothetical protein